jgi:hypothetical protein
MKEAYLVAKATVAVSGNSALPSARFSLSSEGVAAILGAVVGAALALAGTWFLTWRQAANDRKALREGLRHEIAETEHTMVAITYLLLSHLGTKDRALIQWVRDHYKTYKGLSLKPTTVAALDKLLEHSDDEIKQLALLGKAKDDAAISVKTFELPFLESQLGKLTLLPIKEQAEVLEFRRKIGLINQEILQARFFYESTYAPGQSTDNVKRLGANILNSYNEIAQGCRRAVDTIPTLRKGDSA